MVASAASVLEEEERIGEPKPIEPRETRFKTSFCSPMKAPVKMKRMLSVRTLNVSPFAGPELVGPEPEEKVGDDE